MIMRHYVIIINVFKSLHMKVHDIVILRFLSPSPHINKSYQNQWSRSYPLDMSNVGGRNVRTSGFISPVCKCLAHALVILSPNQLCQFNVRVSEDLRLKKKITFNKKNTGPSLGKTSECSLYSS